MWAFFLRQSPHQKCSHFSRSTSPIKWEPFGEFDRFFNDALSPIPRSGGVGFDLSVDVYEKDGSVVAEMNLPGMDPEKLDVTVEESYLTIAGSREEKIEDKDEDKHYFRKEIRRGSFERTVHLPCAVEKEGVEAEYDQGTLKVVMKKQTENKNGKVKITVKK